MTHMLKERKGNEVIVRCGEVLKLRSGQHLPDINVVNTEGRVTCPGCTLGPRP